MIPIILSVGPIIVAACLLMLGGSLLGIAATLALNVAGISKFVIGLVMSAFFVGFFFGSVYGRRLISHVGHIRAFAGLATIGAMSTMGYALAFDPLLWAFLRAVYGFSLAGLFTIMESWLNDRSTNETRGRVFNFYMAAYYVALTAGQLFVNFYGVRSGEAFTFAAFLVAASVLPVVLARKLTVPDIAGTQPIDIAALYRQAPVALVGAGLSGLLTSALHNFAAIYMQDLGFSLLLVSIYTSAMLVGGFLLLIPIGRLSDRVDRRKVLLGLLILALLASVPMTVTNTGIPYWTLVLLVILVGGAGTCLYPTSTAHAYDRLPRSQYIAASGTMLLVWAAGAVSGPIIASLLIEWLGPRGLFVHLIAVTVVLIAYVIVRLIKRAPAPLEGREALLNIQATSPAAAELDPRTPSPDGNIEEDLAGKSA